ncbi:MAG TPA: Holliday junction resolvase RuvX [Candidatus Saccharimonadales bacterium]|jgi:putative Holliday junction resolvase
MVVTSNDSRTALALDVGTRRIGVASANLGVRFAGPLTTLENPDSFISDILALCQSYDISYVVIGLPRGVDGQDTAQTAAVQVFGRQLESELSARHQPVKVYWTDEALTSAKAEQELQARGKPFAKGAVDALAATYILEDFLREHPTI